MWKEGPEYDAPTSHADCRLCGAWRGQYGLEPTPELYVEHTMQVFDALWRVLRDDGVLWWNVGDTRSASGGIGTTGKSAYLPNKDHRVTLPREAPSCWSLKPKDLCLIPLRVAMAAQARGWYVRSDVIWQKPNVKPESVKDRPTDSYEYIFMFTKSERYWYDMFAVLEPASSNSHGGGDEHGDQKVGLGDPARNRGLRCTRPAGESGRNLRDVWSFTTHPYPGAHFASFPPELPRRCIEAGCPTEICLRCGRPRERLLEKEVHFEGGSGKAGHSAEDPNATGKWQGGTSGKNPKRGLVVAFNTTGWSDCGCNAEFVPGIVLDPFAGTGTTGMAAREVGRDCILIEAAAEYIEQMRVRLTFGDAEVRRRVKAERESAGLDAEVQKMASHSGLQGGKRTQVAAERVSKAR
jgi:DNA modification methylase